MRKHYVLIGLRKDCNIVTCLSGKLVCSAFEAQTYLRSYLYSNQLVERL
jgi:hypothetical protein